MNKSNQFLMFFHFDIQKILNQVALDLNLCDKSSSELVIGKETQSSEKISEFTNLEKLIILKGKRVDQKLFNEVCNLPKLSFLYIENSTVENFDLISKLSHLEYLSLSNNSKAENLDALAKLNTLKGLDINHFPKIHDISFIKGLINLEQLSVSGSIWKDMTIESLQPISGLHKLQYLMIPSLRVKDKDIRCLASLSLLKQLWIANWFPQEDFEYLKTQLPKVKCKWFLLK